MAKHKIGPADELEDDDSLIVSADGLEVGVYKIDGEYYALANFCPHQKGPLCEGDRTGCSSVGEDGSLQYGHEGEYVSCPWHSWKFDIKTGEGLVGEYRVPTFEVENEDGVLYLHR